MRLAVTRPTFTILTVVSIGCAYYNGLYNANQLAKDARQAEREGRRGAAQSLWSRAAVKAESVSTRYPNSKYRDDALLLQGRSLSRIGRCQDAVSPLRNAVASTLDRALRAEAGILLGECHLRLGQADSAWTTLSAFVDHEDSSVASRARLWRGRAAMAADRPAEALEDLNQTTDRTALFDRALALAALDLVREAASTLDTARQLPFDEARWRAVLDQIGAADLQSASALVERLLTRADLTSGERARLLMADGERWARADPAFAVGRYVVAESVAGDSVESRIARAHLVMAEIRRTTSLERVVELTEELGFLMLEGGEVINAVGRFADLLDGIEQATAQPPPSHADLRIFRSAELARDSLRASPLASQLFLLIRERHPRSVIAPKALLAAAILRLEIADSLHRVLGSEYPDSPYTKAAAGHFSLEYMQIEDSLRSLAAREIHRPR